jgi:hypothetical protein
MDNNELAHVGIMGMKWGHRKGLGGSSSVASKKVSDTISRITSKNTRGPNSTDHSKVEALKGKKMSTLSNAQLRTFNERVQLEKTYKQLIADKGATNAGKKFAKDMIVTEGKKMLTSTLVSGAKLALGAGLAKGVSNGMNENLAKILKQALAAK